MTTRENLKYQVIAAQCGFAFEILFTILWGWFGHNLPPASPNLGAQETRDALCDASRRDPARE
jgi:hypothetical protein